MGVKDYFKDKIIENFKYKPTGSQKLLFNKLAEFVVGNGREDIILVSGYAGTGKTSSISAFIKSLKDFSYKYILMAPTGRAAKVLSYYSEQKAYTIHKQIYRQKSIKGDGELPSFNLNLNLNKNTYFVVDECSLISNSTAGTSLFGTGGLLDDLISFVRSNTGNKLVLIGDDAQLPPIGLSMSPAMNLDYLAGYGDIIFSHLTTVVRQTKGSGILYNATLLREDISKEIADIPKFKIKGFSDISRVDGENLIETITDSIDKYGIDEVIILCRSNKRANKYNAGIRASVFYREERLVKGEKLMIVKNCYQFLNDIEEIDFIANGDIAELQKVHNYTERYGFEFADATFSLPDYNNIEVDVKIILDTLESESPSLTSEQQNRLYSGVMEDYSHIGNKQKRYKEMKNDPFYNAIQIKYATAITCHKSQGGQWDCVFIDRAFWTDDLTVDDKRWLYTAITRAKQRLYFVNFPDNYFR